MKKGFIGLVNCAIMRGWFWGVLFSWLQGMAPPKVFAQNVGINTSTPASTLSVSGNLSIGIPYAGTVAPADGAIIKGSVGIGSLLPSHKLHVAGGVRAENCFFANDGTVAQPGFTFTGASTLGLYRAGNDVLGFVTDNTERMRITAAGRVGVGVSGPTEVLDVNGGLRLRGLDLDQDNNSQYVLVMNDTGKVLQMRMDSLGSVLGVGGISGGSGDGEVTISLVAGDTIRRGDCVAIGDGATGVSRIQTGAFPFTADAMTKTRWLAQTFATGPKTVAIKAVFFDMELRGMNPSDTLWCSIRAVSGGVPVGGDINNQRAKAEGPTGNASYYTEGRVLFYPPLQLNPNTTYALVVRTAFTGTSMWLHKQNLGMYANGYALTSLNSGATWQAEPTFDFNCHFYFCETEAGKAYPCYPALNGSNAIGWNIMDNSCFEANGCTSAYFGKNDRYDNIVGIAQHDALPGDTVVVQVVGATNAVNSFPLGKKLYAGMPPGKLSSSATYPKVIGLSTGNGMVIQVGH